MKACVEEFEEKLNKFHADKKEQEITARNAQAHSKKTGSLDRVIEGAKVVEAEGTEAAEGTHVCSCLHLMSLNAFWNVN